MVSKKFKYVLIEYQVYEYEQETDTAKVETFTASIPGWPKGKKSYRELLIEWDNALEDKAFKILNAWNREQKIEMTDAEFLLHGKEVVEEND